MVLALVPHPATPLTCLQSKQYLAQHAIDAAHRVDIFALAVTPTQILSGSGESSIKIYSTVPFAGSQVELGGFDFPIAQSLQGAHKIGCHHIVASTDGRRAVSVGFAGEVKVWRYENERWVGEGEVDTRRVDEDGKVIEKQAGEVWAVALSAEGQYLVATTYDGKLGVWDLDAQPGGVKVREMSTKGSFGMCVDLVSCSALLQWDHVLTKMIESGWKIHC